jgi:hypothetical protein
MSFKGIYTDQTFLDQNPHVLDDSLFHICYDIRELALLQFGLPKYRVHVTEAVLNPAIFFDVIQVDEAARVGIAMHGLTQSTISNSL